MCTEKKEPKEACISYLSHTPYLLFITYIYPILFWEEKRFSQSMITVWVPAYSLYVTLLCAVMYVCNYVVSNVFFIYLNALQAFLQCNCLMSKHYCMIIWCEYFTLLYLDLCLSLCHLLQHFIHTLVHNFFTYTTDQKFGVKYDVLKRHYNFRQGWMKLKI